MKLKSTKSVLNTVFLAILVSTGLATGPVATLTIPQVQASEIVFTGASNLRELTKTFTDRRTKV